MTEPRASVMDYIKYVVAFVLIATAVYAALLAMDIFTPEAFALVSAGLVAWVFEKFTWLKDAWDKLSYETKQLVMWIFMAVLVFGAFGLSCFNVLVAFACTFPGGFMDAFLVFWIAVGINQGASRLSRRPT